MKNLALLTAIAAAGVSADWSGKGWGGWGDDDGGWGGWGGDDDWNDFDCARSCVSSYKSGKTDGKWGEGLCPTPTLLDCISAACPTEVPATAWPAITSAAGAVCDVYSACSADPSGAHTFTLTYDPAAWSWNKDDNDNGWKGSLTTPAVVTITGCPDGGSWGDDKDWDGKDKDWDGKDKDDKDKDDKDWDGKDKDDKNWDDKDDKDKDGDDKDGEDKDDKNWDDKDDKDDKDKDGDDKWDDDWCDDNWDDDNWNRKRDDDNWSKSWSTKSWSSKTCTSKTSTVTNPDGSVSTVVGAVPFTTTSFTPAAPTPGGDSTPIESAVPAAAPHATAAPVMAVGALLGAGILAVAML